MLLYQRVGMFEMDWKLNSIVKSRTCVVMSQMPGMNRKRPVAKPHQPATPQLHLQWSIQTYSNRLLTSACHIRPHHLPSSRTGLDGFPNVFPDLFGLWKNVKTISTSTRGSGRTLDLQISTVALAKELGARFCSNSDSGLTLIKKSWDNLGSPGPTTLPQHRNKCEDQKHPEATCVANTLA